MLLSFSYHSDSSRRSEAAVKSDFQKEIVVFGLEMFLVIGTISLLHFSPKVKSKGLSDGFSGVMIVIPSSNEISRSDL